VVLLQAATAHADSMRCGNLLVLSGDRQARVLERCGDPDTIESSQRFLRRDSPFSKDKVIHEVNTERWYYDFGGGSLPKVLTFENGILTRIDIAAGH
jgi:hypothetical protein